jgi:hypothetical protein
VLFEGADFDTVSLESKKFQFLEAYGGPVSHGIVGLPDGRFGHVMEVIPGTRQTIVPSGRMSYEDWREAVQTFNKLSRNGIVLRDPQFIRDISTGRLRLIDIDPIRTYPHRAEEFYTSYKGCWRPRVAKMTPDEIARHQARARANVASRTGTGSLMHVREVSGRAKGIDLRTLASLAELPVAIALPHIERGVAEDFYRSEYSKFNTVISQLGDRLDSNDLAWIKSELELIHGMKQSSFGAVMEFISYGQGSLLEQQAGSLGVLRRKLERKYPDMGWQRSWTQWFQGQPQQYLSIP